MAKGVFIFERKKNIKRKGVDSKSGSSSFKGSDNYKKPYKGQGK